MPLELFQSAPGLAAGRCSGDVVNQQGVNIVSIRARPGGRAMLHAFNLMIRLRVIRTLREPVCISNPVARAFSIMGFQFLKEQ